MSLKNLVFSIACSNIRLLITLMHFCVYLDLTLLCNLAYEIKSSIIFFRIFSNAIVYLLMLSCSIVTSNNNSSNSLFNILSNFSIFITF